MNEIPKIENYMRRRERKKVDKLLLNIESCLAQINRSAEDLETIIIGGEDDGIVNEIFNTMFPEEKRRFQEMFEGIEFKIRSTKNRIIAPDRCRRRPPLR